MSRIFTRGTTTLIVCSHGIALFLEHMDDEQEPKISSEISPHINDKQLGRLNSYQLSMRGMEIERPEGAPEYSPG